MPRVQADPAWPTLDAQLAIGSPHVAGMLDGTRIAVRPVPGELQVYKGALWAKDPGEQLRDAVLQTLEESGKLAAVARQGSGLAARSEEHTSELQSLMRISYAVFCLKK